MTRDDRTCDVAGCPKPEDHFPVVQLVLPMEMGLAAELMKAVEDGCQRAGLEAVLVQHGPDHGNGRLYARELP
jgi:hypothetical protein